MPISDQGQLQQMLWPTGTIKGQQTFCMGIKKGAAKKLHLATA